MHVSRILKCAVLIAVVAAPASAAPIPIGQIDAFQDLTTMNWEINEAGFGSPPAAALPVNADGGPAGAGDRYLRLTSLGGIGSGSRLNAINDEQWAGDYLAGGVTAIAADVNNLGQTELALRLVFENPMGAPPTDVAFSTDPVVVPVGSGWMHIVFPITPSDLTSGLGSIITALSDATAIRIYHSPAATFPHPGPGGIPAVSAQLGVDNIEALGAVPEPMTLALFGGGLAAALARRRRRTTH